SAFQTPEEGQRDVELHEEHRILRCADHGERQELGLQHFDFESFNLQRLTEGGLGEINVMVVEIPVFTVQVLHVRPNRNEPSAGFQAAQDMAKRLIEALLVRQMLEEIAGEY